MPLFLYKSHQKKQRTKITHINPHTSLHTLHTLGYNEKGTMPKQPHR